MESTPAENTRLRARSNRAESTSSIEEIGETTIVARAQVHAEPAHPFESIGADRTLAILPAPTPPPPPRSFNRAPRTAPSSPTLADAGIEVILAEMRRMEQSRVAEARTLADRLTRLEQAQSSATTGGLELTATRTDTSTNRVSADPAANPRTPRNRVARSPSRKRRGPHRENVPVPCLPEMRNPRATHTFETPIPCAFETPTLRSPRTFLNPRSIRILEVLTPRMPRTLVSEFPCRR